MSHQRLPLNPKLALSLSFLAAFLLAGCMKYITQISATIAPAPLVGKPVILHVEIKADGRAMPNTTLEITLPAGVQAPNGGLTWSGDIGENETKYFDIPVTVTTAGDWSIYIYAFSHAQPGSQEGFGRSKTLYIHSSATTAEVVQDTDATQVPVPVHSGEGGTMPPGSLIPITPSLKPSIPTQTIPATFAVGQHIVVTGELLYLFADNVGPDGNITSGEILYELNTPQTEWMLDVDPVLLAPLGQITSSPPLYVTVEGEILPDRTLKVISIQNAQITATPDQQKVTIEGQFGVIWGDPGPGTPTAKFDYVLTLESGEAITVYFDRDYSGTSQKGLGFDQKTVRLTGEWGPTLQGRWRTFDADTIERVSP